MLTVENRVGRLVELRAESPLTYEELLPFHDMLAKVAKPIGGQIVICTDFLGARVFPQNVTQRWTAIIRQESPIVDRNGVLVGEGAVFSMQIERIIREAGYPNRRAFLQPLLCAAWLGEILNPRERTRLDAFIREGVESRAKQKP
jgi:hypothetical protein